MYCREVGKGPPVIVLHGGPDFDQSYLLPDMDRLSDSFHLIYYDQRGRGKSADHVRPEDVTLASDIADLEKLRLYLHLNSVVLRDTPGAQCLRSNTQCGTQRGYLA